MARGIFDQVSILCSCRTTGNFAESYFDVWTTLGILPAGY